MAATDITTADAMVDNAPSAMARVRLARQFGGYFVLAAILVGALSFLVLLGFTPIEPTTPIIFSTIALNALFVGLLVLLVGREIAGLVAARRRGRAAARLHIRIVGLFGIVASLPAIVVAIIAGLTLDQGLERIFEKRTQTIVDSSVSVARSYVNETTSTLLDHTVNMAFFLKQNRQFFNLDRRQFAGLISGQARARRLAGAMIVDDKGRVILRADTDFTGSLPRPPMDLLNDAGNGNSYCILPRTRNLAACATQMKELGGNFLLYTLRNVDPSVLNSLQLMEEITDEYRELEANRVPLQVAFGLLYFGICLTVLLAAIWMGIAVADRLMKPIQQLIGAAQAVRSGKLDVQVPTTRAEGELRALSDTFNAMTKNLQTQRAEILNSQEQIDRRRRFTEAVLSGVSAGVIGVSGEGTVAIANSSASEILNWQGSELTGQSLHEVSPELANAVAQAERSGRAQHLEQVSLVRQGQERTLNVRVTADDSDQNAHSHVVTIDDISDLVTAQRTSAWADVARRIAHEIKNPLTPIQLSAERIRRRYGKVITEDREVFDQCTDTIIRQVADIGRMVDEFSSFARMPKPSMTRGDLADPLREAVFLLKVGNEAIHFDVSLPDEPAIAQFDSRLLGQAFGNLLKNATEAIEGVEYEDGETPRIEVTLTRDGSVYRIDIIDNGKGLPETNRQRLLEPYMTTREKGTGLGLAIVGKVLEEHGGTIQLMDAPAVAQGGRGACVRVELPVPEETSNSDGAQSETGESRSKHGV